MKKFLLLITIVHLAFSLGFSQENKQENKDVKKAEKLTPEEIVTKHLASIGTPEDLAAVKSRVMIGQGRLSLKLGGSGALTGPAQMAATGNMFLFAMIFNSNNYPYEKIGYNGKDLTVGIPDGQKTDLGKFLQSRNPIMKEGLLGGVLSTAWPLLDTKAKKVKLEYGGTQRFGEKDYYKLKYTSGVGDLKVTLYFDSENFRHVLTEYKYTVESNISRDMTEAARAKPNYYTLTETFSDFKTAGKLTIPFSYKINLTAQEQESVSSTDWAVKFADVYYDEKLDAAVFKVS
ncbi:MAG TPA: hypothetical protein VGO50_12360 [Pyrinomonadaceae bacterium]|nr:hypothetical protein [Pyrinomonadaceae bacterium]